VTCLEIRGDIMDKPEYHFLTHHTEKEVIVLTFTEPTLNADAVMEAISVINAGDARKIILDCQTIRYLVGGSLYPDQEPFTPLLKLRKQLTEAGSRLTQCNVNPDVADVFRITRLDRLIEIQPSVKSALACIEGPTTMKMPRHSHTQHAPLCLILYGSALASLALGWMVGETPGMYIAGSVGLLIASLATCFHRLTVQDQGEVLAIQFGPVPLFRRSVQ